MMSNIYDLIEKVELKELNGIGYLYRHKKSQAHIAMICNDDHNKVFSACFPTPVKNNKGIPHILEHSVLCGSRKYPLKDPFVELMKGSMNTFLNAMTFDDMTLYPVASCNDKDFKNLMDIYLDAVFYPHVLNQQEIFMQEGWHYEIDNDKLYYNGVVYNEMKGYASSPEYMLEYYIKSSLYPQSCYSYHSGGYPQDILQLNYNELREFYKEHYAPYQSLLFVYGHIDVEERLQYLDREYLSHFEAPQELKHYHFECDQKPIDMLTGYYDCNEDLAYYAYNIVVSHQHDLLTMMSLQILDYVLVSSPGALIRQALLNEKIGQDVYSSFSQNIHYPSYSIICMNAKTEEQQRFFEIVESVLQKIICDGLDEKMVYAAFHALQFQYREQDFGRTPKGLYYNQQILMKWLFKEEGFFDLIEVQKTLHDLENIINAHQFDKIVKDLIDLYHHSKVFLYPQAQYQSKIDEKEIQSLQNIYRSLDIQQKQDIVSVYQQLLLYQDTQESEESLACIPLLERKDLPTEVQKSINETIMVYQTPLIYHELFTHGIGYLKLSFDLRYLPLSLLPYASLLNSLLGFVNTNKYSYLELYDNMALTTGGIYHQTFVYDGTLGNGEIRPSYEITAKMLYHEIDHVEELIKEMLFESCFDDDARIMEILMQEKASLQTQFMNSAHIIALNETRKDSSMVDYYMYNTDYLGYYTFICDLIEHYEHNDFVKKIHETMSYIFNADHLMISYTGERESLGKVKESIKHMIALFGYHGYQPQIVPKLSYQISQKAYTMPSQVQFVGVSGRIQSMSKDELAAFQLLQHILRCDYLWHYVRVKGGAYGCFSDAQNHQILSIVSYRDPHLKKTLEVYHGIRDYVKNFDVTEREMLQYIIGAISDRERPLSAKQIGNISFSRAITGVQDDFLNSLRRRMIDLSKEDIQQLLKYVLEFLDQLSYCVIGNENTIQKSADLFDDVKSLL